MLRANPSYLDARVQLGLTLYTLGRTDEARASGRARSSATRSRDDARMYLRLLGGRVDAPAASGPGGRADAPDAGGPDEGA